MLQEVKREKAERGDEILEEEKGSVQWVGLQVRKAVRGPGARTKQLGMAACGA